MEKLKIEKLESDRCFNYWEISGLTPEEVEYIHDGTGRDDVRDRLCEVMEHHGNREGECLKCGYGIYSVSRKFDPHCLVVKTGSSCD